MKLVILHELQAKINVLFCFSLDELVVLIYEKIMNLLTAWYKWKIEIKEHFTGYVSELNSVSFPSNVQDEYKC